MTRSGRRQPYSVRALSPSVAERHLVPGPFQIAADDVADRRVIVNDENSGTHRPSVSRTHSDRILTNQERAPGKPATVDTVSACVD